jgi:phosphonopyruvate decarboxylase
MIDCHDFYEALLARDIDFFAGVPDSLLKDINAYITEKTDPKKNIIAANEGGAIGLAVGYHLATRKIPMVYLQNSGLGNTVNPLMSIADPEVYGIPMLLLIGWRGEPGVKDEPQHIKQGRISNLLLENMEIPYSVLDSSSDDFLEILDGAVSYMRTNNAPYALVVRKDTFNAHHLESPENGASIRREQAIEAIIGELRESDIVVSTTGKCSREVFEIRERRGEGHEKDFLCIGGMGHVSQIALALSLNNENNVYCIDGDGSLIMHMGSMGIIGSKAGPNFKHILINNGAHESVGAQPTIGDSVDFRTIAKANNYRKAIFAETIQGIEDGLKELMDSDGPGLLEIKVKVGARSDLGRPSVSPSENKVAFMNYLSND